MQKMEIDIKNEKKPRIYLEEYKLKQDPHDYGLSEDTWDLKKFKKNFRIVIIR